MWIVVAALTTGAALQTWAARSRWRDLTRPEGGRVSVRLAWAGAVAQAAALVLVWLDGPHPDLAYAVLGVMGAALTILLLTRVLDLRTPGLLLTPVAILSLLTAAAVAADLVLGRVDARDPAQPRSLVGSVHILFMSAELAASLLAGAAGALYVVAEGQLKTLTPRALRLPGLPRLASLTERSLAVTAAMLLGGVLSGVVAGAVSQRFTLLHFTPLAAIATLLLAIIVLLLRGRRVLSARGLAWWALAVLAGNAAITTALLMGPPHG